MFNISTLGLIIFTIVLGMYINKRIKKKKKVGMQFFLGFLVWVGFLSYYNEHPAQEVADTKQVEEKKDKPVEKKEKAKQVTIKIDHSKQSADDDDNATTRAIEPPIAEGLKNLNPNFVKEVIINANLARKTPIENDTWVILDVLFVKGTDNKNKEETFVEIVKQLSSVKSLNKFAIWTFEKEMYNPDEPNQYMMVVYTKHLPSTSKLTFDNLVEASNNGSINGEMYFNQNRN